VIDDIKIIKKARATTNSSTSNDSEDEFTPVIAKKTRKMQIKLKLSRAAETHNTQSRGYYFIKFPMKFLFWNIRAYETLVSLYDELESALGGE